MQMQPTVLSIFKNKFNLNGTKNTNVPKLRKTDFHLCAPQIVLFSPYRRENDVYWLHTIFLSITNSNELHELQLRPSLALHVVYV